MNATNINQCDSTLERRLVKDYMEMFCKLNRHDIDFASHLVSNN
jgi:hypothetical protein